MNHFLDITNPDPKHISISAIAHRLSNICRFGGETKRFYSVAEHSVFVLAQVSDTTDREDLLRIALMHDAAEAYTGDLVDIPASCYQFGHLVQIRRDAHKQLEHRVRDCIFGRFGLPIGPIPDACGSPSLNPCRSSVGVRASC